MLTDTVGHRLSGSPAARPRDRVGRRRDEARRPRERAHRTGDGAQVGARERERRDRRAGAPSDRDARPRQQRRHAAARRPGRGRSSCAASTSSTRTPGQARGRIVFFNVAVHQLRRDAFAFEPARPRARRATARSPCSSDRSARTGFACHTPARCSTRPARPKIPAAAIASEDADRLQRMADRGDRIVVRLQMDAHFEPDVESANVVGELRGREKPDEIRRRQRPSRLWDVGDGASDDGGGCIVTWEALRMMKKLELRPRRTVRVVLWTNEENGGRGGQRLPRPASRRAGQARDDARIGRRRVPAARLRLHGQRHGAPDGRDDRDAADGIGADSSLPAARAPTSGRACARAIFRRMSLDVDTSRYFLYPSHRRPTRSTRSIPVEMAQMRRRGRRDDVCRRRPARAAGRLIS